MLAGSATVLGSYFFGQGRAGRVLSSAPLPPGHPAAPLSTPLATPPSTPLSTPSGAGSRPSPAPVPDKLGVPVKVVVADHQVKAPISVNRLNADNSLYVPPNPRAVSWASQDVAPGSGHGTIILVGHINSGGVEGAFADLADYRVGQRIMAVPG